MYKSFFPHNFDYIKVYSLVFYMYSQCVNPLPLSDTKIFPSLQKGSCITISEVKWSRVRLFETPWTVAYQAPLSMGFSRQ